MTTMQQMDSLAGAMINARVRMQMAEVAYNALHNSTPLRIKVEVADRFTQAEADYRAAVAAVDAFTDAHDAPGF